jgi:hypothetical protein
MSSRYVLYILGYPYDTMILNKELLKFAFWLILKIILSTATSQYGLNTLGYTYDTMVFTIRSKNVS